MDRIRLSASGDIGEAGLISTLIGIMGESPAAADDMTGRTAPIATTNVRQAAKSIHLVLSFLIFTAASHHLHNFYLRRLKLKKSPVGKDEICVSIGIVRYLQPLFALDLCGRP